MDGISADREPRSKCKAGWHASRLTGTEGQIGSTQRAVRLRRLEVLESRVLAMGENAGKIDSGDGITAALAKK